MESSNTLGRLKQKAKKQDNVDSSKLAQVIKTRIAAGGGTSFGKHCFSRYVPD